MYNYTKIFVSLIILITVSGISHAQRRTFSPYSRYGIGEIAKPGFARNIGMGGTGIAHNSSSFINNINPASYTALDTMALYFEAGVSAFSQNMKTAEGSSKQSNSNFDYFAIGFPLAKRVKSSLGLTPYSYTGYNVKTEYMGGDISNSVGSGNLSKAYFGLAIEPIKNISLGMNANFLFGKQQHTNFYTSQTDNQALAYGIIRDTHISDITLDFGAQYLYNINKKHSIVVGMVFAPKTSLNGDNKELKARGISFNESNNSFDSDYAIDTIYYKNEDFKRKELEIPMSYGVGAAYSFDQKLTVTADFQLNQWAKVNMPAYSLAGATGDVELTNSSMISFGAEYLPDNRLATTIFSRIKYRIGAYRYRDYIKYYGTEINETGFSVGLGLPILRDKSSLNISFIWGSKGSTSNNLIKENFARVTLDITMFEYWFIKRKFD
jgi:hypothetical protein